MIRAGARRLPGDVGAAAEILDAARATLPEGSGERGLAEREHARVLRARALDEPARDAFLVATRAFEAAGERWLADATEREADAG